jgi:hypothetical protein
MKREILFIQEVATQADLFYDHGVRFGQWAARALGGRRRAQITGLESIANSSLKVSDVLDYLKKQTAKSQAGEAWRRRNDEQQELGPELIAFINSTLGNRRNLICSSVERVTEQAATEQERQQTYLALIREFVRQVAAQYELEVTSHDA